MAFNRMPAKDPRAIARDIPGIFDMLCPHLNTSIVKHLNRQAVSIPDLNPIAEEMIKKSSLKPSMLFEISYARTEQILLYGKSQVDWKACIDIAIERQRRHFDAILPKEITDIDFHIATEVADNLVSSLHFLSSDNCFTLYQSPIIPGYQWINSGNGDFAIDQHIIEVKCTERHFSAADYRQIIIYWFLSHAASVENSSHNEWKTGTLLNPRLNLVMTFSFSEILYMVTSCESKKELLELFAAVIREYALPQHEF